MEGDGQKDRGWEKECVYVCMSVRELKRRERERERGEGGIERERE